VALENGFAEVFGRFHRMAAKFPNVKDIIVLGSYSTTEAYLDTEKTSHVETQYTYEYRWVPSVSGGQQWQPVPVGGTVTVTDENTVVKDREAKRAITFFMPSAQIPDTLDNKAISDAVLSSGKIILAQ